MIFRNSLFTELFSCNAFIFFFFLRKYSSIYIYSYPFLKAMDKFKYVMIIMLLKKKRLVASDVIYSEI